MKVGLTNNHNITTKIMKSIEIRGLKYLLTETGGAAAVLICELCGERIIENPSEEIIFENKPNTHGAVFIHKTKEYAIFAHNECMNKLLDGGSGEFPLHDQIEYFFGNLLFQNSNISPEVMKYDFDI
jgi:hypothetical protein